MFPCTEQDRAAICAYLAKEPEMNLFFFGDIENYGVDKDPVHVYALPGRDGWDCLLLQYFENYVLYSQRESYNAAAVAAFLQNRPVDCISGKLELVEKLCPYYPKMRLKPTYMSRCNAVDADCCPPQPENAAETVEVRPLTKADMEALGELLFGIEEFSDSYKGENGRERCLRGNLENLRNGLIYGVFENGVLASTAQTSAANSQSAMVVAVATKPQYRGRGYASAVVTALCRASFAQGKKFLCLFYDNPAAGRIYRRIGFEEIGRYAMLR